MSKVKTCVEQVSEASIKLGIPVVLVDETNAEDLRARMSVYDLSLINAVDCVAVRNDTAWRWIKDYIKESKTILWFSYHQTLKMFEIKGGESIVSILEETYCDPILITNYEADYLLEYNNHGHLIAYGNAIGWLKQQANKYNVPLIEAD